MEASMSRIARSAPASDSEGMHEYPHDRMMENPSTAFQNAHIEAHALTIHGDRHPAAMRRQRGTCLSKSSASGSREGIDQYEMPHQPQGAGLGWPGLGADWLVAGLLGRFGLGSPKIRDCRLVAHAR